MMYAKVTRLVVVAVALTFVAAFQTPSLQRLRVNRIQKLRPTAATVAKETGEDTLSIKSVPGTNPWEVHKFGGASLATPELYRTVGDLLIDEATGRDGTQVSGSIPTMAIVSAMGGMTDLLIKVVDSALVDFDLARDNLNAAVSRQLETLKELAPPEVTAPIEARINKDAEDILSVVQSLRMIHTVPAVTMEVVTGFGEIWSAQTLHAYLQTKGVPTAWIDAREVLIVKSDNAGLGEKGAASTGGVVPLWAETATRMAGWWNAAKEAHQPFRDFTSEAPAPIVVVTGFVATTANGVPTTLKRSGSDYSATIFAKLMGAGRVTMWKNTDGVYTADPRRVPEAFPISSLKYDEAMELAYFGAQVLHPSAMVPCIDDSIPVYVRNIFNPAFEGTVIQGRCTTLKESNANLGEKGASQRSPVRWRTSVAQSERKDPPIKGITSIDNAALVNLEGATLPNGGTGGVAERFLGAMQDAGITVLMITQASSESSICVAVPESEGERALAALQDAFELELARSAVSSVSLLKGMSVVAIVGEGMAFTVGVTATFMNSLAAANVNIHLIAQGSSERQVAVVVKGRDCSRALRAVHQAFTLSETATSLTLIGATGSIGRSFLDLVEAQQGALRKEQGLALNLVSATSRTNMVFGKNAGDPIQVRKAGLSAVPDALSKGDAGGGGGGDDGDSSLAAGVEPFDLERVTEMLRGDVNPHRVVIDFTDSDTVAEYYERWLEMGVSVVSGQGSKAVVAGPLNRYRAVKDAALKSASMWQYESSVGSALPIVTTLRDLMQTGDKVRTVTGSVSGTFAYVFRTMKDEGATFSQALRGAMAAGYTEPDPRDDLTGGDMARKVAILAREIGLDIEVEDVNVESLLPPEIASKAYPSQGAGDSTRLSAADKEALAEDVAAALDEAMAARQAEADADGGKLLRYKFVIDAEAGTATVRLAAVGGTDPLYRLRKDESLVSFATDRYATSPLIVKGAAAGPLLAASGVFADVLRLARAFKSSAI